MSNLCMSSSATALHNGSSMPGWKRCGGGFEKQQVFLSQEAMSLVTKMMPQLAIRILKGYNDSVLAHLLEFDNGAANPWCPPDSHDIEQYFEYSQSVMLW